MATRIHIAERNAGRLALSPGLLLTAAILAGAFARCFRLGNAELTTDEAASWGAAVAPTISAVVARQHYLNPGKLALHDIVLHVWIGFFGDGEVSLRGLSTVFGITSIVLVYFVAQELLASSAPNSSQLGDSREVAAISALITALNLLMIRESREARMYAITLAMTLAQVGFFLRAVRRERLIDYAAVSLFTALAIACNFTTGLVFGAEVAWIVLQSATGDLSSSPRSAWRICAALIAGLPLLLPFQSEIRAGVRWSSSVGGWVSMPDLWEPLHTFENATGGLVFAVLAPLAAWGSYRAWARARAPIEFALIWMWLPPLAMVAGSYLFVPMLVTRYVLSSFVPFFILVALGINCLPSRSARLAALSAVVLLSLIRANSYYRKPHDVQWREACALAVSQARSDPVGVVDYDFERYVVGYYLRDSAHALIEPIPADYRLADHRPALVIMPGYIAEDRVAGLSGAYPQILARFRGVEVISR